MPTPLSETVSSPFSASNEMDIAGSKAIALYASSDTVRYLSLSIASDALDTSSRRKISRCEYSEWMMSWRSWLTSVWN